MHFLRTPLELVPSSTVREAVGGVSLEVNELQAREDGSQAAVGLGRHELLPVRASQLHCSLTIVKLLSCPGIVSVSCPYHLKQSGKACRNDLSSGQEKTGHRQLWVLT